jgi:hypothetical protein
VAILHWHWFLPTSGTNTPPTSESGPAIHAYAPDWQMSNPDDGPQILPDPSKVTARLVVRSILPSFAFVAPLELTALPAPSDAWGSLASGALPARGAASTASLLQRWDC